ncbi:hypothetical protein [Crocosphaera sp.]|uniref:hypothetical protein n=1 Tax=Crocosphaera sp. TaxID=2729996 RepID=UPI003F28B280|nr:hypothetical protein [Crocosphaera sp.]
MQNSLNFSDHNYPIIDELGRNREGGQISYVKPENILINQNLNAYLIDFGLAKIN